MSRAGHQTCSAFSNALTILLTSGCRTISSFLKNIPFFLSSIRNGAEPTDTVRNLLSQAGVMKKFAESKKEVK